MLHWPKGPHPADGLWASHWYNAVWNSDGFGPPTAPSVLTGDQQRIAEECRASYQALARYCV
jgi:hypothetical protein